MATITLITDFVIIKDWARYLVFASVAESSVLFSFLNDQTHHLIFCGFVSKVEYGE